MSYSNTSLVLTALAILTAPLRGDDWQSYQHDAQHTGRSSAYFDPAQLTLSWSAPTGYATPAIVGNSIFATKNGGGTGTPTTVSSFDLSTGAINWSYSGNFVFPSQAAYGNNLVVFSGRDSATSAENLYVLNSATGALKYTVPLNDSFLRLPVITLSGGNTVAYLATGSTLTAVHLGANSGSTLWNAAGSFGGSSIPSLVGNSILLAGPGQYYSVDAATGINNHFQAGGISGGGGTTVAVDSARNQFYVLEVFNSSTPTLTAYQYVNNSTIVQKWQKTGPGITNGCSVAIGANGNVYASGGDTLLEIEPVTGLILRSKGGQSFANQVTPIVTATSLITFSESQTLFYSLNDLSQVKALPGSRGSSNTPFDSPGAVDDKHFILDYGNIVGSRGFDVYTAPIPEPSAPLLLALGTAAGCLRRMRPLSPCVRRRD